jgi:hypothetical protein
VTSDRVGCEQVAQAANEDDDARRTILRLVFCFSVLIIQVRLRQQPASGVRDQGTNRSGRRHGRKHGRKTRSRPLCPPHQLVGSATSIIALLRR